MKCWLYYVDDNDGDHDDDGNDEEKKFNLYKTQFVYHAQKLNSQKLKHTQFGFALRPQKNATDAA